jgi:hypothetical protein
VGLVTRVRFPAGVAIFFSTPQRPDRLRSPLSLVFIGYRDALYLKVMPPGLEADHSPPSSADVKNVWL